MKTNDENISILEKIANSKNKTQVANFLETVLPKYLKDLDLLISSIKSDEHIEISKFEHLRNINDVIIKEIEDISKETNDPIVTRALGEVFRNSRPEYYYASEIMKKGFKKYRGYPGDFEMMHYVYNNAICSLNIVGKYFDKYFLENAYAVAVRGRKNKMVDILMRFINSSGKESIDILNLPCGPARDIKELFGIKDFKINPKVNVSCVDQDDEALAFASSSVVNLHDNVAVSFNKGNIINYIRNPAKYLSEVGQFDLVYSIGLADYLPDKLLMRMILFSFKLLKPCGTMIYAFKITDKDPFAPLPPKWFCDWQFVSRDLKQSWDVITQSGIEGFEIQPLEWEESGRIAFLIIKKT